MANTTIAIKKSATAASTPGSLEFGELAINYADGKIFYKNVNSSIVEFAPSSGGGNSFGTVNANSTLVVADTAGDILTLLPGTNISIVGDAVNDTITFSANIAPAFDKANLANVIAVAAFAKANSTAYTSNVTISVADNTNAALRITQTGNGNAFVVEDSGNPDSTPFVIDANGNVAIGSTSTDLAKLFVDGTIIGQRSFTSRVSSGLANSERGFRQAIDGTEYLSIYHDNSNAIIEVNSGERIRIKSDGNVGIGTTSTSIYKLNVDGSVNAASILENGISVLGIAVAAFNKANVNVSTTTSTATLSWNSDTFDQYQLTAMAAGVTVSADSGTPVNGQKMIFRFKDNGTARSISLTTGTSKSFRAIGVTLPTTTVISKTLYVGAIYNSADDRWDVVATAQEA
jgi:hypothetical protein